MSAIATAKTKVPANWDATKIPSLEGKTAIVTGANSGIGYPTALELARHGAHVVLACRSEQKGNDAVKQIRAELASAPAGATGATSAHTKVGDVEFMQLDVSSLASVRTFADRFKQTHTHLDILVNNAGIMAVPYALSVDGVESQFATNHLGHFALTAQLFELLQASAPSRIVNVSSALHREASHFDENAIVATEDKYAAFKVYASTKLANLLFTKELDRRIKAAGVRGVTTAVCHPGVTETNLVTAPVTSRSFFGSIPYRIMRLLPIFQSPEMGALPTLYAATAPNVQGGDFFGPDGFRALKGFPVLEEPDATAESKSAATKLWTLSERLAKLSFDLK